MDNQPSIAVKDSLAPTDRNSPRHKLTQDNIQIWGLDIHNPVFLVTAGLTLFFCFFAIAAPGLAGEWMNSAKATVLESFDWFFVLCVNFIFLFCVAIGLSPLGKIRLGGRDAKPEFSVLSWIAMLFSAGIGIGMVFYGAAEPLAYYVGWGGTPLDIAERSAESERLALAATLFHWSLTPWAVYAVVGLALAFFTFNRQMPLTMRSAFHPILGDRVWGWPGHVIDIFAVIATIFGLATSLGFGAMQASRGIEFLLGSGSIGSLEIVLIVGISLVAMGSVILGLDRGIRVLSNVNMVFAALFLLFVFIAGPTWLILSGFAQTILDYARYALPLSNWVGRDDVEWYHGWTIFYWAWWVSWAPFVGMFIARISRGRTIRQFLTGVLLVPFFVMLIWFVTFGRTAIEQSKAGVGKLAEGIEEVPLVLFEMLVNLPFPMITSFVAVCLLIIFFVTSSDSGSLVIDGITAGGKMNGPVIQKIFWVSLQALVAIALLVGGGASALGTIQAGAIASGLPLTVVLLVCCFSLFKGLLAEHKQNE